MANVRQSRNGEIRLSVSLFPLLLSLFTQLDMRAVATVYEGGGAEYGTEAAKDRLVKAQAKAKRRKIGMWSRKGLETPREYKRRTSS